MTAILLNGQKVAEKILKPLKKDILKLKEKGIVPTLAIILVGEEDPQSLVYIREKRKKAKELGISLKLFKLKKETKEKEVKRLIQRLNQDVRVSGILVQLPLPKHLNPQEILETIDPKKEVDGLTPLSPYPPACARGILEILSFYHLKVENKKIVIVGAGRVVGKPLFHLLKDKAKVILSDRRTKDLKSLTKSADILICATPVPDLIGPEMVKKKAIVIDVNKNVKKEVKKVASFLTPKIGGVGPTTVAILLKNLIKATKLLSQGT